MLFPDAVVNLLVSVLTSFCVSVPEKQSAEENKELNRRIAVHIVTVCEKLFSHYLHKAQSEFGEADVHP